MQFTRTLVIEASTEAEAQDLVREISGHLRALYSPTKHARIEGEPLPLEGNFFST